MQEFFLEDLRAMLEQPGDGEFRDTRQLQASLTDSDAFARALLEYHAASTHATVKSRYDAGYDFYHDLVLRHLHGARTALLWKDGRDTRALSYVELHAACSRLAATWTRKGIRAGSRLCIIAPAGVELFVPLLTALRLGLFVTILPPLGPDFLSRRLGVIEGAHIATARRYLPLIPQHAAAVLTEESAGWDFGRDNGFAESASHTYAQEEPAFALFSPLCDFESAPLELTAKKAYIGALRDGLLLLSLGPGVTLAAPELPVAQYQPALFFATLLQGGTYCHLGVSDLLAEWTSPQMPVQVLFVSPELRDAMLAQPARPLTGTRLFVMNPQDPPGATAWSDWIDHCRLQNTPAAMMLIDAGCGGVVLFSMRRAGRPPWVLQPAFGQPFALLEANDSGQPATAGYGVWDPVPDTSGLLLGRVENGFEYRGTLAPTRRGQPYLSTEVEHVVMGMPFVVACSIIESRGPEAENLGRESRAPDAEITLLVFTGPEPLPLAQRLAPAREAALRDRITARLGPQWVPPSIELYAMFPRCRGDRLVDHAWCERLYREGLLRKREAQPLFRVLDRIRLSHARPLTTLVARASDREEAP